MTSADLDAVTDTECRRRESHHRIKNSLQLAASMLRLQAARHANTDIEAALGQASLRITAIAKVHDRLSRTAALEMDVAPYLRDLCSDFASTLAPHQTLRVMAAHVMVPADVAISIGLIVNELVTNAFRHAFPDELSGKVQVAFIPSEDGSMQLVVADNGIGLPNAVEMTDREGLGMVFVRNLCSDLNAGVEIDRSAPGTRIILRLPTIFAPKSSTEIYA